MHDAPASSPIPFPPNYKPTARTMKGVVAAFAKAKGINPDLQSGINLHIDLGPETMMKPGQTWGDLSKAKEKAYQQSIGFYAANPSPPPARSYDWSAVEALKNDSFNAAKRRAVFHYAIFCNLYGGADSSGISRGIAGADFIVSL